MIKDEVLSFLGIKKLPTESKSGEGKCIVFVDRMSGRQDYAVAINGGIVIDKKPMSAVKKIISFFPLNEVSEKDKEVAEEPERAVTVEEIPANHRDEMIAFLVKNKMKESVMKTKTDGQLEKLVGIYKK